MCDFTFYSTVFQSYQGDDRLIIKKKTECNGTPSTVEMILPRAGIELATLDQ